MTKEDPCEEYIYPTVIVPNTDSSLSSAEQEAAATLQEPIFCKTCKNSTLIKKAYFGENFMSGSLICVFIQGSEEELQTFYENFNDDLSVLTQIDYPLNKNKFFIPEFYNQTIEENEFNQ